MTDQLASPAIPLLNSLATWSCRTATAKGYPPRQHVAEQNASWAIALTTYAPPEYTARTVLQNEGKWADPTDVAAVQRTFFTRTPQGDVPVGLNEQGRPLNPIGRTGLQGRGLLGKWGRNQAGDALLTRLNLETSRLQLLVIERRDCGQKALPGGMVDEGEDIATTVARELNEETGATLSFDDAVTLFAGIVDDPRNTDNAWMETTVLHKHLTADETIPPLQAGDDASAVQWVDIDQALLSNMYASHGQYLRLALQHLMSNPTVANQARAILGIRVTQ